MATSTNDGLSTSFSTGTPTTLVQRQTGANNDVPTSTPIETLPIASKSTPVANASPAVSSFLQIPTSQVIISSKPSSFSVASSVNSSITTTPTVLRATSAQPVQSPSILLNAQPTLLAAGQPILQAAPSSTPQQPMLQIQLQPQPQVSQVRLTSTLPTSIVGATYGSKPVPTTMIMGSGTKQPQLLPKPFASPSVSQGKTRAMTPTIATATATPSLILNQSSMAATGPLLINNLGQIVGSATQATGASQPILIPQANGNPLLVLRSTGNATSPLLPIVSQTGATATATAPTGQILLQQPQTANVITAQPQVKIITPQGRMQMQQIQTPTGPKLIAVPVGQTLVQTGLNPILPLSSTPTVISSTPSKTMAPSVIATPSTDSATSSAKGKKKNKKAKAKTSNQKSGLDLGELMKDVGLDLDGFGMEDTDASSVDNDTVTAPNAQPELPTQPVALSVITTDSSISSTSTSGSQILAQIQQPLPLQTAPSQQQLQLVQGPDGQFVLQNATIPTPTIMAPSVS